MIIEAWGCFDEDEEWLRLWSCLEIAQSGLLVCRG
jgi:hypothetical protein